MASTNATTISEYNDQQSELYMPICNRLRQLIDTELAEATSKLWHGGPVWFLDDNPVAGYWVRKNGVQLLFWSGQSFNEPGLTAEGTFKAAECVYADLSEIDEVALQSWLKKSRSIQWDYKNIVKRKGELVLL